MKVPSIVVVVAVGCSAALTACASRGSGAFAAPPPAAPAAAAPANRDPWPRQVQLPDAAVLVYSPQVESWQGNQLAFRCAVAVTPTGQTDKTFGVVWATARTDVDRVRRRVSLEDLQLTRSSFPTVADNGAHYLSELQQQLPPAAQTIALDRLEASLAASGTVQSAGVAVKNAPPQILVSYSPAILVPIDGATVVRAVPDSSFQRVINTQALIATPTGRAPFYMHVYDGWLTANAVDGPWTQATSPPAGLDGLAQQLSASKQVDLLDGAGAQSKPSLANGVPAIYVAHAPAELIVFKGQPNLQPVANTGLLWAENTTADVLVDTSNSAYYVLLSGRWYTAAALGGPWSYVASNALPAAFSTIPPGSKAGVVLAAVAGTPQAREAVIENSIPQTASVPRNDGPTFTSSFDGAPKLKPIAGTPLQYVVNSPSPVIRVDAQTYYALSAGVWYAATSAQGPWVVAASVPEVIYTIPPSSPLYYVTYVRVYGATPEVVYVGYTPGYLGTVVTPDGTVVYGTGYDYDPWIGDMWYAPPVTYGLAAQPVYNPAVGYSYGFALGLTTAAIADSWNEPTYYDTVYRGYPCCGSASANVHGQYGNVATAGTRTWYSDSGGTAGETASGSYKNDATGTTGRYSANESYNPYTGQAAQGYNRTINTTAGGTGDVNREETYNADTRTTTYGSQASGTTAGGSTVSRDTEAAANPYNSAAAHQTTVDNAKTGQTNTVDSARVGDNHYADVNGNVYSNTGNGWQQHDANGWQNAGGDTSWADREQQARSASADRFGGFQGGGWADRGGGYGGARFGGGGGGFGGRFGGGGFRR